MALLIGSSRARVIIGAVLGLIGANGCQDKPPAMTADDSLELRADSLGKSTIDPSLLVLNDRAKWGPGEGFTISSTPLVEIGGDNRVGAELDYRILPIHRFNDGRIAVLDRKARMIFFLRPDGQAVAEMGGKGGGPGEFSGERLYASPTRGDSIGAFDMDNGTLTIFDPTGKLGFVGMGIEERRSFGILDTTIVLFDDGSVLTPSGEVPVTRNICRAQGENRHVRDWLRVARDGKVVASYRRLFFSQQGVKLESQGSGCQVFHEFRPRGVFASLGHRLYYSPGDRYEIKLFDADGRLLRVIRRTIPPPRLQREDFERYIDRWHERDDPDRPSSLERVFGPLPTHRAAISDLKIDGHGNIWAADYPTRGWPESWDVYDSTGVYLGPVRTPEGLRIVEIGKDYVLGYSQDKEGINRIKVYGLGTTATESPVSEK